MDNKLSLDIKKKVLFMGGLCNNRCICCYNENKTKKYSKTIDEIKSEMLSAKKKGAENLEIIGGEPTIRSDFKKILPYAKQIGYKNIDIISNGRMFSYVNFCRIICPYISKAIVKIRGFRPHIHDSMTQVPGSLEQTIHGIKNLQKFGVRIVANIIITEQNYISLPETVKCLINSGVRSFLLEYVKPSGIANKNFEKLAPRFSDIVPYVFKTLDLEHTAKWIKVQGIPYCLMKNCQDHIIDLKFNQNAKIKFSECKQCKYLDSCGGVWRKYTKIYGTSEFKPVLDVPEEIKVEVIPKCNLSCYFCFKKNNSIKKAFKERALTTKELLKVIDKVADAKIPAIRLTGGEPFLRKDLEILLRYAKSKDLDTIVNTNGTLINDKSLQLFNYIDYVLFSLNGYNAQSDYKITGLAYSFNKKIDAINKLSNKFDTKIMISTVMLKENIEKLEKFYDIVNSMPICSWVILRPLPIPKNLFPITNKDVEKLIEKLLMFKKEYNRHYRISNAIPFCSYDPKKVKEVAIGGKNDDGHTSLVIDPKGIIKPSYFMGKNLGDIRSEDILDVWNCSHIKKIRNLRLIPKICQSCKYVESCKGGSRSAAKLVNGSCYSLDPLAKPEKYIKN